MNCDKQGRGPGSRHEVARELGGGTGRAPPPPSPDGKQMEIRKRLNDF